MMYLEGKKVQDDNRVTNEDANPIYVWLDETFTVAQLQNITRGLKEDVKRLV